MLNTLGSGNLEGGLSLRAVAPALTYTHVHTGHSAAALQRTSMHYAWCTGKLPWECLRKFYEFLGKPNIFIKNIIEILLNKKGNHATTDSCSGKTRIKTNQEIYKESSSKQVIKNYQGYHQQKHHKNTANT